ncbi:conserved hypothetical protein (putative transposase or invertase) [Methylomagnum ishizawai]|uniref:PD-(D/E)XK nuclease family transposase n=1 Tax=Methylomagnum ishizawai TaxID=1760988 RepID=A0A1Y6D0C6_9GAMM|nr:Rpn family recombination-promoting nuclease/putative transposase [Methylomagnum ishizawai]SMF93455.1 conserved hypothetical protein (putative transposase or invertase) [Methylomagnum ishizawai]
MKHRIDPKIDCVFKALLGAEENRNLLIHFLNAVLDGELPAPITEVQILNPFNEKEFLDDKLSIVDVKAQDGAGRFYQIEIQLVAYRNLPARMAYTWADLYTQQLRSGQDYEKLTPTYAIWLLADDLFRDDGRYARHYKLRDERGQALLDNGGIWTLELGKFAAERVETEEQRWLKLFNEGDRLNDTTLPDWMNTLEMRQAMETLRKFSEKELNYFAYQARENFLREQRTIALELEEARHEREQQRLVLEQQRLALEQQRLAFEQQSLALEQERIAKEQAEQGLAREQAEKAALLAELERLKAAQPKST